MFRRACFILFCLMLSLAQAGHAHELRPAILSIVYSDTGGATLAIDLGLPEMADLQDQGDAPVTCLVKGSRSMGMEAVVAAITDLPACEETA